MNIEYQVIENPSKNAVEILQLFWNEHQWDENEKHIESSESNLINEFDNHPNVIIKASYNSQNVGFIEIYLRKLKFKELSIYCGCIGDVVTHTNFRLQKIGRTLVNRAFDIMKSKNVDIAVLWTDLKVHGNFYQHFGFVHKKYKFINKIDQEVIENQGMIAPVLSKEIFIRIINSKELLNIGRSNV